LQHAVEATLSKLSIHSGMGNNSWKIVENGKPRLIKLLDVFDGATQIKSDAPGIVVVGRIYLPDQPTDGDPQERANEWWSNVGPTIMQYPDVDYWEGYNEPDVGSISNMNWYASFEAARVKILLSNNRKACIGSFSTGVPDVTNPDIIQAWYPAVDVGLQAQSIMGLHEYSSPYMQDLFTGDAETGDGWLTGRYRKLYNQFLIPTNRTIPLVISENGIDGGTCGMTGCDIAGGWKNFCSYWQSQGSGSDCNNTYLQQLEWYDSVMRADSYVLGSTVFSLEIPGWDDFDIAPLTDIFIQYLQAN